MKTKKQPKVTAAPRAHLVSILLSVQRARKYLAQEEERVVTKGLDLPLEIVAVLSCLYRARCLGGVNPPANREGFVTVRALRDELEKSGALLSVRLKRLQKLGMIEIQQIPKSGPGSEHRHGLRSSRSWVRILHPGIEVASLVWARYVRLAERVIGDVHPRDLETHFKVNEIISRRCEGLEDGLDEEEEEEEEGEETEVEEDAD